MSDFVARHTPANICVIRYFLRLSLSAAICGHVA